MQVFLEIFSDVVLPVLLLVGVGAVLQKRQPLDINTLSKVTIWLLVPSFLFVKVYQSNLTWTQIGGVSVALLAPMIVVALIMWGVLRRLRFKGGAMPGAMMSAMVMSAVVVNAGNFGIPVAELTYGTRQDAKATTPAKTTTPVNPAPADGDRPAATGEQKEPPKPVLSFEGMTPQDGVAVQALCVLISNLTLWGFGYIAMALAKGGGWRGALGYFRLPMIYAIVLAFVLRDTGTGLPKLVTFPLQMLTEATVPVMLITLGAQLARTARLPDWRLVIPVSLIKLIVMPLITWPIAVMLGMWPWPGAQLVVSAAGPAAVNVLFITLEMGGDADLAADCVFWSTVFCAATVTVTIAIVASA